LTDQNKSKPRKLSLELLGGFALCLLISIFLYQLLYALGTVIVDRYYDYYEIVVSEEEIYTRDYWMAVLSLLLSLAFFILLSMFIIGERLSYINVIIKGINALRMGEETELSVDGNNELTRLAESVNYLSAEQKRVRAEEEALIHEREQFIRTMSHDIRTPLTSILSYTEILTSNNDLSQKEKADHLILIRKKAEQIRDLTDVLLDGGSRNPEYFEDASLLIAQLADEFESELEGEFTVSTDISECQTFSGSFDVRELQRIFDNIISNIKKYADHTVPVNLTITSGVGGLVIVQSNKIREDIDISESYGIGLKSIRRIAMNYSGTVDVKRTDDYFEIKITLSEI